MNTKPLPLYQKYADTTPIAVYCMSNFGGLEILDNECGYEDYAIASFNFSGVRQQIKRHKICYTPWGRAYITKQGKSFYFDEMKKTTPIIN